MGAQTRHQEYRYQYKSMNVAGPRLCNNGPMLSINLPDNVLEIKSLWTHFVASFDSGVATANQKFFAVGSAWDMTLVGGGTSSLFNPAMTRTINLAANLSGIVDQSIDLTSELALFPIQPAASGNQPFITLAFTCPPIPALDTGCEVIEWKVDLEYTTQGIR